MSRPRKRPRGSTRSSRLRSGRGHLLVVVGSTPPPNLCLAPTSRPNQGSEGARRERQQEQGGETKRAKLAKSELGSEGSSCRDRVAVSPPRWRGMRGRESHERPEVLVRMVLVGSSPPRHPAGQGETRKLSLGVMWKLVPPIMCRLRECTQWIGTDRAGGRRSDLDERPWHDSWRFVPLAICQRLLGRGQVPGPDKTLSSTAHAPDLPSVAASSVAKVEAGRASVRPAGNPVLMKMCQSFTICVWRSGR